MSVEIRRLQSTRDGTFLVTLPKEWAKRFKLRKGSPIHVKERVDGCLVLDPRYGAEETQEIVLKPSQRIEDSILSSYLLGYEFVAVEGPGGLGEADRNRIKRTASRLIGVEVIEEDEKRILLQCLLRATAIPPEKILRRQYILSKSLLDDAFRTLLSLNLEEAGKVRSKDEEIDRLYFLLVRILRSLIVNPRLSEKLGISPIDCLDYRLVASLVERIADTSVEVAELVGRLKAQGGIPKAFLGFLEKFSGKLSSTYEDAVKALFSRGEKTVNQALKSLRDAAESLRSLEEEALRRRGNPPALYILLTLLGTLIDQIKDIMDLAFPRPQP
ncbi:TPA: phosphate uptake regulator PhoU [Candidatus Bathyarchaeota archaeon]|nr:phosphate uptake regulator PhoU [Candidatus Bathyarchaeota archaeon]